MDAKLIKNSKISEFIQKELPNKTRGNFFNVVDQIHKLGLFETLDPLMNIIQNKTARFDYNARRTQQCLTNAYEGGTDAIGIEKEYFRIYMNIVSIGDIIGSNMKEYLSYELSNRCSSGFKNFVTLKSIDISKLFELEGIKADDLQALYFPEQSVIFIAMATARSYDLTGAQNVNYTYSLLLQLQTVIASMRPDSEYFPAAVIPALELMYGLAKTTKNLIGNTKAIAAIKVASEDTNMTHPNLIKNPIKEYLEEEAGKIISNEAALLQLDIQNTENSYITKIAELDRLASKRRELQMRALLPVVDDTDYESIVNTLDTIKGLQFVSFGVYNGKQCIVFHAIDNILLDKDLIKPNFINNEKYFQFYKGILDGDFTCNVGYSISISMTADRNGDPTISFFEFPYVTDLQYIPNPHLSEFQCLGSNRDAITRARNAKNWVMAAIQSVAACTQLNLADITVRSRFENNYLKFPYPKVLPITLRDGTQTTWHDYYREEPEEPPVGAETGRFTGLETEAA